MYLSISHYIYIHHNTNTQKSATDSYHILTHSAPPTRSQDALRERERER